ncbi:MAG: SIS domain-containing protein [Spirochaetaceae bacterium]|jgi:D-sedoheptulose 7-phosphate isomerase|nr:SIS domain-containing protein [Spirochaetaceae bacterium]
MKEYHPVFKELFCRYTELESCAGDIALAGELLEKGIRTGKKILLCGNGGSAADADHITGELVKSFCRQRPIEAALAEKLRALDREKGAILAGSLQGGIPAINLTGHIALSTAFGNDVDPYQVFAQQTLVYGAEGDLFWGISTSGNAKNIYYAALVARAKGMRVLGMTGKDGGALKQHADVCIKVPKTKTYEVQELHLPIYHALCRYLEECFW